MEDHKNFFWFHAMSGVTIVTSFLRITHFCGIRNGGGAGPPSPNNDFRRPKLTPSNYISLEREYNSE